VLKLTECCCINKTAFKILDTKKPRTQFTFHLRFIEAILIITLLIFLEYQIKF